MNPSQPLSDYALAARKPTLWLSQARTLQRAAALIWTNLGRAVDDAMAGRDFAEEQLRLMGPYMLLSGLALENLFKGILVLRRPVIAADAGVDKKAWTGSTKGGHDLERMALEVLSSLSEEERDLLKRLHVFVVWGGRYPIPLKASDFVGQAIVGGPPLSRRVLRRDPEAIHALFGRLVAILERESTTGRP